tara:strand:- start:2281 stop:3177 length:897 start_codon:yes stop_codon:yes gene_type:complete
MKHPIVLWRVEVSVTNSAREAVENLFENTCIALTAFESPIDSGIWKIGGLTDTRPRLAHLDKAINDIVTTVGGQKLSLIRSELIEDRDWVADNIIKSPAIRIGRYFIHGSHIQELPPPSSIPIEINPSTAFGSGEHPSSAGCLTCLLDLVKKHKYERPLDLGCGSGILAIALAKTLNVPVVASDLDSEATRVTKRNAKINNVGHLIRAVSGDGYCSPTVNRGAPYDLILANILAFPLIKLAGDLDRHLRTTRGGGGTAVLSGIVERDGRRVLAAHKARGLRLIRWHTLNGWLTLVINR